MLDCRAAAAQIVAAVIDGETLERALERIEPSVRERDRALLRELCYGSLRWHVQLAALIKPLLQKPLKPRDSDIEQLLIIGAYQLLHTRIPAHAALNSAVEASRHLQKNWAAGLINAVLRKLQRESAARCEQLTPAQSVAHPQWLWKTLSQAWPEQADAIFAANNSHPPMCLRVNRLRGSLKIAAVKAPGQLVIEAFTLNKTNEPYGNRYTLIPNSAIAGRNLEYYRYDGGAIKGSDSELLRCMAAVTVEQVHEAVSRLVDRRA